ncbi:MAG TPA: sigma-54 dependent transcriptional regulator [Rubricoccaceae bacterium]|nr:sigma-54 dependent transcriptional regulator [Rubricoccaceae bacterium]
MDRQAFQERFGLLGDSPALRRVIDRVRQVAAVDITVLLEGESGVGKELVANALHELSPRRHRRMVVVNCGAIPEGLIESELFGAEKGAYTGAVERRTGYFEEADGGTLFLDEIGEMPLAAQVRLLRVLESGQFSRVGSSQTLKTDVRVVAATNKNLAEEVRHGRFREDLYYRLSAVVIPIPALRQRREDVVPIFEHYLYRYAQQYDAPRLRLSADARELLRRYNWPGNVRELRNVAEQAVVLVRADDGATLTADALRPFLRGVSAAAGLTLARREPAGGTDARERELIYRALLELRMEMREVRALLHHLAGGARPEGPAAPAPAPTFSDVSFGDALADDLAGSYGAGPYEPEVVGADDGALFADAADLPERDDFDASDAEFEVEDEAPAAEPPAFEAEGAEGLARLLTRSATLPTVEEAERALILEALRRFEGNRRQTAEALGMSERTLYRKIKDLEAEGIDV